jgi:hypothetical protein
MCWFFFLDFGVFFFYFLEEAGWEYLGKDALLRGSSRVRGRAGPGWSS